MNNNKKEYVTVMQFVGIIWEEYLKLWQDNYLNGEELLKFGWNQGWLEEQDILWKDCFIERRNAARIVHEFLRLKCGESDEKDIRNAEILTDLYDCRACANHVAQVYLKGIMKAKEERRFQLLMKIEENEAREIVRKMFSNSK